MKRIQGLKIPAGRQTEPVKSATGRARKAKREMSPEPSVQSKKEPKRAPWRMASSNAKPPVGLESKSSRSRNPQWRENSVALNRSMVLNQGEREKSKTVVSKMNTWGTGRPLWGVKPDNKEVPRISRSQSQQRRFTSTTSNIKPHSKVIPANPKQTLSAIAPGRNAVGGKEKNRYTFGHDELNSFEEALTGRVKGQHNTVANSGKVTLTEQRLEPKNKVKSAMKKVPKTLPSANVAMHNEASQLEGVSEVDQDCQEEDFSIIKHHVSAIEASNSIMEAEFYHGDHEAKSLGYKNPEKVQNGDSVVAVVTDPTDVESLRRISNYNEENPNSNYFLEFNQVELKGRTSERFGGLKKIMTPQFRSKRLSKNKNSAAKVSDDGLSKNKERISSSYSYC